MTIGVARACPPFLLGFDVLSAVSEAMLREATARGFKWCGRYLETMTGAERDLIFRYGFGILPYTEAMIRVPLSAAGGRARGVSACARADALEAPPAVHVGIDLELPAAGSDVAGYVDAFADALVSQARGAALYVGDPQPLSGPELFDLLPNRYIKGGGAVVEPTCGGAALQLEPLDGLSLAGVAVDVEVSKHDYEGRALIMWWPS